MYRRRFLVALLILLLGPLEACRNSGGDGASGGTSGSLRVVTGTCKVTYKTETKVHGTGDTATVPLGALLETDDKGCAVVSWGKTEQILQPKTKLTYLAESKIPGYGVSKVELLHGLVSFLLPQNDTPDFKFQAASHSIVAAVKGTAFDLRADGDDGPVQVATARGTVHVFERKDGDAGDKDRPEGAGKALAEVPAGDGYATAESKPVAAKDQAAGSQLLVKPFVQGLNKGINDQNALTIWEVMNKVLLGHPIING